MFSTLLGLFGKSAGRTRYESFFEQLVSKGIQKQAFQAG